jgi:hypothetical protein
MPFTLAHAAAALPFRRTRLVLSAVVVGTLAPDFEYFVRLLPSGHFGHTLRGVLILDLPLSLAVLWLFHAYMREPIVALLPDSIQRRIFQGPSKFRFWGPAQLVLVLGSILAGAATHILWDSFTHPTFWPYRHWEVLSRTLRLPIVGTVQYYKLFQHGSTAVGIAVLLIWFLHWRSTTVPNQQLLPRAFSWATKKRIFTFLIFIAFSGALIRAFVGVGMPHNPRMAETFVGATAITAITLVWLQLLIFGIVCSRQQ